MKYSLNLLKTWITLPMENELPHYVGHRNRLRDKAISAADNLADYELLELLLFNAIPRKDVKPLAKKLLQEFHSLAGVINATQEKLYSIEGVNSNIWLNLLMIREFMTRILKQKLINVDIISNWSELLDYLKSIMGELETENFRVLFLNKKNILVADEILSFGTVDQAVIYPREIIKRALFHNAVAIILVHNHPSGNITPSKSDLDITYKIRDICQSLNIIIHDHVIIAKGEYYSFKSNMLI